MFVFVLLCFCFFLVLSSLFICFYLFIYFFFMREGGRPCCCLFHIIMVYFFPTIFTTAAVLVSFVCIAYMSFDALFFKKTFKLISSIILSKEIIRLLLYCNLTRLLCRVTPAWFFLFHYLFCSVSLVSYTLDEKSPKYEILSRRIHCYLTKIPDLCFKTKFKKVIKKLLTNFLKYANL